MELWIRSQDRKNLIEVRALYTDIPSDFGQEGFGVYCDKRDSYVSNTLLKIGQYKSKERALEVLDEIQNLIYPKNIIKYNDSPLTQGEISQLRKTFKNTPMTIIQNDRIEIEQLGSIVYEMPEE